MSIKVDRLRQAREEKGLSQRELARLCGIGDVLIYRYEKGISEPSAKHFITLAEKLGVSLDYLAGLSDNQRGQIGDKPASGQELEILEVFRSEGWPGVIRLGGERLSR